MRVSLAALCLAAMLVPLSSRAQRRTCDIEFPNVEGVTRQIAYTLPSGERNVFLGGGVHAICRRDKMDIRADSAEYYGDEKRLFLVGHVIYDEPRIHLTSDYLTYFGIDERLVASSNVNVRMPSGSTMTGPQMEYLRRYPQRPVSVLTAIGRPTVTLVERAAPGAPPEPPATVLATTFVVLADSLIHGVGQVEITRPDLVARGDSAFIDSGKETMRLMRTPSIDGRRGEPYRLTGETIDLFSSRRKLQRVISRGAATATSQDMTLSSDTIDLRVANDLLQEAIAWGKGRARAKSTTQDIIADSIRVDMPGQRARIVYALRGARAETTPDTTRIKTKQRDWLSGDTLVAWFDTTRVQRPARRDTTARDSTVRDTLARREADRPRIERIRSAGDARAFYHLAPSDSTATEPAINYVRGRVITVTFDSAQVSMVNVEGQSTGLYLDPLRDTVRTAPGATATPPRPGAPAPGSPRPSTPVTTSPVGPPATPTPTRPTGRP